MGTVMTWAVAQVRAPGASCQMVSLARWTARASHPPLAPGARVAVAGGRTGSGRQERAAGSVVWAWLPVRTMAAAPLGPNEVAVTFEPRSGSGCDRDQWAPLSVDQAASRYAAGSLPAASRAVVVPVVVWSRSTVMFWCRYWADRAGAARCQAWPV